MALAQHEPTLMSLRFQGLAVSALAWIAFAAGLWLPHLVAQVQLVVLCLLILLLGVPQGAVDMVLVRQLGGVRSMAGWRLFASAYVAAAASVVGSWWVAPGFFLAAFLLVSAFHFSGDPEGDTSAFFRMLYGDAVTLAPWHCTLHRASSSSRFWPERRLCKRSFPLCSGLTGPGLPPLAWVDSQCEAGAGLQHRAGVDHCSLDLRAITYRVRLTGWRLGRSTPGRCAVSSAADLEKSAHGVRSCAQTASTGWQAAIACLPPPTTRLG